MFAVADGPPGVAASYLSSQERASAGVHVVGPERSAMIAKLQVLPARRALALLLVPCQLNIRADFCEESTSHGGGLQICSTLGMVSGLQGSTYLTRPVHQSSKQEGWQSAGDSIRRWLSWF